MKGAKLSVAGGAVLGNDSRSFSACCDIQGLPKGFDIPFFSLEGKKQAIANGVPLPMSRYLAKLILKDYYGERVSEINVEDTELKTVFVWLWSVCAWPC
jgi:DNA (cytosine-5)-methyltransferase 1